MEQTTTKMPSNLQKRHSLLAPLKAYTIQGLEYQLYADACDVSIAAILQQIQPNFIKDLKITKIYDQLFTTYTNNGKY